MRHFWLIFLGSILFAVGCNQDTTFSDRTPRTNDRAGEGPAQDEDAVAKPDADPNDRDTIPDPEDPPYVDPADPAIGPDGPDTPDGGDGGDGDPADGDSDQDEPGPDDPAIGIPPDNPNDPTPPADPIPATTTVTQQFAAGTVLSESVSLNPEYQQLHQIVTMSEGPPISRSWHQIERPSNTDHFRQGHDGSQHGPTTYSLADSGVLDLLVVVDDSTSMSSEHRNLAARLDPLISHIENTDWQIGVVTTSDPCLQDNRVIRKADGDRHQAFADAVMVTLRRNITEKGFPMAIRALREECNQWLRDGSQIAVLVISDEDNCGSHNSEHCEGEEGETAAQMVDFLHNVRPQGHARVYGIFEGPGNPCGDAAFEAPIYKQAVDITGGTWGSICDQSYTDTLAKISENVNRIVVREIDLDHVPVAGTEIVTIDGQMVQSGYEIRGNKLILDDIYADSFTLSITYNYGATPKYRRFALTLAPDPNTIEVSVNSDVVGASEYSFDPATREIVFVNEPLDNAAISVSYRLDEDLPASFPLSDPGILEVVEVTVAGQPVIYTYDQSANAVTLATPPADGERITAHYRTEAGLHTQYDVGVAEAMNAIRVSAVDVSTGQAIPVSLSGDKIRFELADVTPGRVVEVVYDLGYPVDALTVDLTYAPLPNSVTITTERANCTVTEIQGNALSLDCGADDVGMITIGYQREVITNQFTLAESVPIDADWSVFVNGDPIDLFQRVDQTVTIDAGLLSRDDIVTITVKYID